MKPNKMWMTADGYQKLQSTLVELRTIKRPATLKNLQDVSGSADWRENSQLILFQNELALIDAEIRQVEEMLKNSEVVEPRSPDTIPDTIVDVGETVVVQTNGDVETYTIVSPTESAPDEGRISYESPLGKALLKHQIGDDVDVDAPVGTIHYRIVALR